MAEEETPISKVVSSGLEMEITGGEGLETTVITPSSTAGGGVAPQNSSELLGISGEKRVSGERLLNVRSRLQYPPGDMSTAGSGSGFGANTVTIGSLFSTPAPSISPIVTFSSSPGQVSSQAGSLSSVISAPEMLRQLGYSQTHNTLLSGSPSLGSDQLPFQQSIPGSSKPITIQENHLLELVRLAAQATQPTPPPPPGPDWFSQLAAALRPTPQPTPPPIQQPTGMESLMTLLVEQLKKQQPPKPVPEPPNPAKELLKMLKVLAGEEPDEQARTAKIPKSATKSRFCDWIANYAFPDGQKVPPVVGTYDGTRDPEDHLALYDQAVLTEKWVDPVACHLFPGTLQGYALEWFTELP